MSEKYLLGIDAGTSVVKSVVFDFNGREVALSRQRVPVETPMPGWAEQDMEKVWEAVKKTIAESMMKANIPSSSIAAIGVTGQGDGCRLLDKNFKPIRPSILWLDGRAGEIVTKWEKEGINEESFRISGSAVFPGTAVPIIKWLELNEPQRLKKASYFLYAKDWIKFKLTGKICTDPSDISRGPIDLKKVTYSEELFDLFTISKYRSLFPEIIHSDKIIGKTTRKASEECGLRIGIPVTSGMIDVVANPVGLGVLQDGQAYSIIGTTCFNAILSSDIIFNPPGVGMNFAYTLPGKFIRAVPSMAGTPNLDWFTDNFCHEEKKEGERHLYRVIEEKVRNIPVGSEGVIYHPYINPGGERAPFVKSSVKAQFFGIGLHHTRWHLLRAVYEGVALSMLDCFKHIPIEVFELRLSGGGAKSPLWSQIFSDAIGKVVKIPAVSELGTFGSVIVAGTAVGLYPGVEEAAKKLVKFSHICTPDMNNHRKYLKIYELYKKIYQSLWDSWNERYDLIKSKVF